MVQVGRWLIAVVGGLVTAHDVNVECVRFEEAGVLYFLIVWTQSVLGGLNRMRNEP